MKTNEDWWKLEAAEDDNSHMEPQWPEWDLITALELCDPEGFEAMMDADREAAMDWWEREGKYEEALEDQGTYKEYLYALHRADQQGERQPHIAEFVA